MYCSNTILLNIICTKIEAFDKKVFKIFHKSKTEYLILCWKKKRLRMKKLEKVVERVDLILYYQIDFGVKEHWFLVKFPKCLITSYSVKKK